MSVLKIKDNNEWAAIPSIKGDTGDAAGFGTATATVDTGVGTPSCDVTLSGDDTAKNFAFAFHNLMYDDSDLQSDFADLEGDFNTLQAQFDTAIAAVSVDDELHDIRVGDDGVTYASAGAAVRGQFHDVKSDLGNVVKPLMFTETVGYYFAEDGTLVADSSAMACAYTSKIRVYQGNSVTWKLGKYTYRHYLWGAYMLYDKNENVIGERNSLVNTSSEVDTASGVIELPTGAYYIAFCYRTFGENEKFKASTFVGIDRLENISEYFSYDMSNGVEGWIRHGTGQFNWSSATTTYVFSRKNISKLKAFIRSDNTVIDGVAFFSGDGISESTYMGSSVAWKGNYPNGTWYDVEVPSGCQTIAVTSANATSTFTPQILFKTVELLSVTDAKYLDTTALDEVKAEIRSHNIQPTKIGWNYIYHFGMSGVAYRDAPVIIPSQSIFDIHNAVNLGFKCIEANLHKTSDGKYVVTHGQDGALGHDFDDLNGNDAYGIVIANTSFSDLRSKYVYRSSVPAYRVQITSLEEFLAECKRCNLLVMLQYVDDVSLEIARGIMGDNMLFTYNAPRSSFDGMILEYLSYGSKENIISRCEAVGSPYIYSMANPQDFTDEQMLDIVKTVHEKGCFVASAYQDSTSMSRLFGLGFDFFALEDDLQPDIILKGKKFICHQDGSVTWESAPL